jgi:hypothetical protein
MDAEPVQNAYLIITTTITFRITEARFVVKVNIFTLRLKFQAEYFCLSCPREHRRQGSGSGVGGNTVESERLH